MHYIDMSPHGNYLEAINNIYDVLRWSETREDAKSVLICSIMDNGGDGQEHKDALFDRIFRATSGK
jgi:hypothetical protein